MRLVAGVVGALILGWVLRTFVGHVAMVSGNSMLPTLADGDVVWLDATWRARQSMPARGDLVAFRAPSGDTMIKRVVGLPGDTVQVVEGALVLNGQPARLHSLGQADNWREAGEVLPLGKLFAETLEETSATTHRIRRFKEPASFAAATVPTGKVFTLGDNRDDSIDSRTFGAIDVSALGGLVRP